MTNTPFRQPTQLPCSQQPQIPQLSALNERILVDLVQLGGGASDGLAFIVSLKDVYCASLSAHLPLLMDALTSSCASDIHHLAHKVKGQSLNLGLDRFAQLLGQIELWPDGFSSMTIENLVAQLQYEASVARTVLNQFVTK
jgi:HPt (histidine-containing phosphotransfer) domain-containing protein